MLLSRTKNWLFILCGILVLNACGFEPIYVTKDRHYIRTELEHVHIKPIKDRIGQELRNNLYDVIRPRSVDGQPAWELSITLTQATQQISLEQTSFSTRANLTVRAHYTMTSLHTPPEDPIRGSAKAISSYNIVDSDYANLVAVKDARSRAVISLSKDIARQLALDLRNLKQ